MLPKANKTVKTTKVAKTDQIAKAPKIVKPAKVAKPETIAKPVKTVMVAKPAKTDKTKLKRLSAGQRIHERRMKQAARKEGNVYHSLIVRHAPAKKAE
jgi:hypothetical protein